MPPPRRQNTRTSVPTSNQALRSRCTENDPGKSTFSGGFQGWRGEGPVGTMDGAGSKTVFAITFDRAAGRGNGFGQEMGNPIYGPFGGVGAGGRKHANE